MTKEFKQGMKAYVNGKSIYDCSCDWDTKSERVLSIMLGDGHTSQRL